MWLFGECEFIFHKWFVVITSDIIVVNEDSYPELSGYFRQIELQLLIGFNTYSHYYNIILNEISQNDASMPFIYCVGLKWTAQMDKSERPLK